MRARGAGPSPVGRVPDAVARPPPLQRSARCDLSAGPAATARRSPRVGVMRGRRGRGRTPRGNRTQGHAWPLPGWPCRWAHSASWASGRSNRWVTWRPPCPRRPRSSPTPPARKAASRPASKRGLNLRPRRGPPADRVPPRTSQAWPRRRGSPVVGAPLRAGTGVAEVRLRGPGTCRHRASPHQWSAHRYRPRVHLPRIHSRARPSSRTPRRTRPPPRPRRQHRPQHRPRPRPLHPRRPRPLHPRRRRSPRPPVRRFRTSSA